MQKILDFISTKTFRNSLCFILFTFLMTGIISSQSFFFQKIIENGRSKCDIIAQKDIKVIDTEKTEQHKKEVAMSIEPILIQAEDDFIISNLNTLQKSVSIIREKTADETVKADEIGILFEENPGKVIIEYLLRASDSDLNTLFDRAKITLTGVLNKGISAKDFENGNVNEIIRNTLGEIEKAFTDQIAGSKDDSNKLTNDINMISNTINSLNRIRTEIEV